MRVCVLEFAFEVCFSYVAKPKSEICRILSVLFRNHSKQARHNDVRLGMQEMCELKARAFSFPVTMAVMITKGKERIKESNDMKVSLMYWIILPSQVKPHCWSQMVHVVARRHLQVKAKKKRKTRARSGSKSGFLTWKFQEEPWKDPKNRYVPFASIHVFFFFFHEWGSTSSLLLVSSPTDKNPKGIYEKWNDPPLGESSKLADPPPSPYF